MSSSTVDMLTVASEIGSGWFPVDVDLDAAVERSNYMLRRGTRIAKTSSDESVPANAWSKSSLLCCTSYGSSKDLFRWAVWFTVCRMSIEKPLAVAEHFWCGATAAESLPILLFAVCDMGHRGRHDLAKLA